MRDYVGPRDLSPWEHTGVLWDERYDRWQSSSSVHYNKGDFFYFDSGSHERRYWIDYEKGLVLTLEKVDWKVFRLVIYKVVELPNVADDYCFPLEIRYIEADTQDIVREANRYFLKWALYIVSIYSTAGASLPYIMAGEAVTVSVENNWIATNDGKNIKLCIKLIQMNA